ncbi:MAG: Npt1/Npt2 family nucleotide transporter, partial [Oscillospiraceae bacterium]
MGEEQKLPEFGKIRKSLWPIYKFELKKFLPMSFMMIFILFVYTLCRDLKDTLLQTCIPNAGTEIVSVAKLFGVIPFSVIFTIVFMKLSNKYNTAKMFYGTITFFVSFFVLFGWVL